MALHKNFKDFASSTKEETLKVKSFHFITPCLIVATIWCLWSGIGGYGYQSNDFNVRNALFRDLINLDWPVFYSNTRALNYYFGFWLPPALLTKIFSPFVSASHLYMIGLNALMIYAISGIFLFFIWIIECSKKINRKILCLCLFLPVFFSGLDIIGSLIYGFDKAVFGNNFKAVDFLHIEWWTSIQYSSLITCLFWVFNQTIISWLATLVFYKERRIQDFGLLFILCFFSGPFSGVGLSLLMIVVIAEQFIIAIRKKNVKIFLRRLFSVQNILSALFLPMLFSFFTINTSTNKYPFHFINISPYPYLIFCLLEFGLYALCIWSYFKKDMLFHWTCLLLCVLCLGSMGGGGDISMRTTIPLILVLILYILRYLQDNFLMNLRAMNIRTILLLLFLLIGSITPLFEFSRAIIVSIHTKTFINMQDDFKTFRNKNIKVRPFSNFLIENVSKKLFYKYFGRIKAHNTKDGSLSTW